MVGGDPFKTALLKEFRMKDIKKIANHLGWETTFESKTSIFFNQYSPAGEDFGFSVDVENTKDIEQIAKEVKSYADDFSVDEHVEMWLPQRGKGGCPDTITGLIEDAEAIKDMLNEFSDFLQKGDFKEVK